MSSAALPISVIVATIEPWPAVQSCLDRLMPQVQHVGGELILADGTPGGRGVPPADAEAYANVRTVTAPGASIFALRARGVAVARGNYLSFTEDHCVPDLHWIGRVLDAHRAHPDALMISGAVLNGSSDGLVDWANFLMTFAEFLPPLPARPLLRVPPMGNCSFRRSVRPADTPPEGWMELVLAPTLMRDGRVHIDERIIVSHVQPKYLMSALTMHFHNGRSCAGLALPHMAVRDRRARLRRIPALPWYLYASVSASLTGRTIPRRARLSLPVVGLLCAAHATGECVGLLWGEGTSAKKLN